VSSFKIIMTMNVTRACFTTQHQTCKTKTKTTMCKTKTKTNFFWSQTGLVLRPTVSGHITGDGQFSNIPILWLVMSNSANDYFKAVSIN